MRGDSLRDFYAKSIALLGLGLLGGIGAAVDYWPTGVNAPSAVGLDLRIAGAGPLQAGSWPDVDVATALPVRADSRTLAVASPKSLQHPAAFRSVTFMPAAPVAAAPAALELAAPMTFTGLSAATDTAIELAALDLPTEVFSITTVAPAPANQRGVFAGIRDGSRTAGAKVANGLQAVGSAVKGAAVGAFRLIPGVGRHDEKQRQNRTILSPLN